MGSYKALQEKIEAMQSEVKHIVYEDMELQISAVSDDRDQDIHQARRNLERFSQAATKTTMKLSALESELRTKREQAKKSSGHVKPIETSDLVQTILEKNRKKAAEAHVTLFAGTASENDDEKDPSNPVRDDLETRKDPMEGKTSAEWAEMAQQVTGFADALYTQPCDAPYYAHNMETHKEMKLLVAEYVRSDQEKLNKEWVELATEYEYRRDVFSKKWKKQTSEAKNRNDGQSVTTLVPRQTVFPMLESGGGRPAVQSSSSNPYRRARRGNEVRTDYDHGADNCTRGISTSSSKVTT
ncbi:hypothetical protein ACA910_021651 [Epithemia clementina (nom. ined.)]